MPTIRSRASARSKPRNAPLAALPVLSGLALIALLAPVCTGDPPAEQPIITHVIDVAQEDQPTPPIAAGQTRLLSAASDPSVLATSWPLVPALPTEPAVTFVPAVNMPISVETIAQPQSDVTVMWTLSLGAAVDANGQTVAAGALRADVVSTVPGSFGPGCDRFAAVSLLPASTVSALQQRIAEGAFLPPPAPEPDGSNDIRVCLGSSCSCPSCPDGFSFAAPFFVIGICNRPGGVSCCERACSMACTQRGLGLTPAEAWVQGQGMFIICMIAQDAV